MLTILNNKCNLTKEEFLSYQKELENFKGKDIILCPSTIHIPNFYLKDISLGAQNVSVNDMGPFTGEVSAYQLASYNVKYCLIGHSERRHYQKETNEEINLKIKELLKYNIVPILCIGESKEEKFNNKTKKIIETEILSAIENLTSEEKNKLIIAYEPIWSIGSGVIPTNMEITEVLQVIKNILPTNKLLYGGSVTDENINTLKKCPLIDGYLLGGLSLKPYNLANFLKQMTN